MIRIFALAIHGTCMCSELLDECYYYLVRCKIVREIEVSATCHLGLRVPKVVSTSWVDVITLRARVGVWTRS